MALPGRLGQPAVSRPCALQGRAAHDPQEMSHVMDAPVQKYRAPALEKGLDLMELLAEHVDGLSLSEVSRALDRSQGEIYRVIATLVRRGYVTRSDADARYALSLKMFTLSQRHPPVSRLIEVALPKMRAAARDAGQSCHLGMENNGDVVVVAVAEAPGNWGLALRPGSVIGLGNTGTGRVLAAFRPPSEVEVLLDRHELASGEPRIDRSGFLAHLERIRERGYDKAPSETVVGVTNLAFPVFGTDGRAVAALSSPYIERIDALEVCCIEEVERTFSSLAQELTRSYGEGGTVEAAAR